MINRIHQHHTKYKFNLVKNYHFKKYNCYIGVGIIFQNKTKNTACTTCTNTLSCHKHQQYQQTVPTIITKLIKYEFLQGRSKFILSMTLETICRETLQNNPIHAQIEIITYEFSTRPEKFVLLEN